MFILAPQVKQGYAHDWHPPAATLPVSIEVLLQVQFIGLVLLILEGVVAHVLQFVEFPEHVPHG